ncbi:MAG: glutamine--tRNA ligase/YqeY domain fusion protein [Betaproteobacteria bacterium]|nr:glutamine--tRNA ligase/YqeY domain fusion protein [Betaproteobacteria bacterium]
MSKHPAGRPSGVPAAQAAQAGTPLPASNFIRHIIDEDLARGTNAARTWGGAPGPATAHAGQPVDPAKIRTRFPPEPNGYLHFGHAKSICLNFGLARDYGGACHMRFDDTNPEKEGQEYVDAILDAVKWLGFGWDAFGTEHLYFASDYFDFMYQAAEHLIEAGHAYVDSLSAQQMRTLRGTLTEPGKPSPYRERGVAENLGLFRGMRAGRFAEGEHVLRAKIDMASPNINLRDPAIYRIRKAAHHRTGDAWCIYPMYTYAHPIEDALENITHSICTLEFEDQRPFYDWLLERLSESTTLPDGRILDGLLLRPVPRQYEFARLNLTYVVLSKRKLIELVEEGLVEGWDDPRMPTLVGARRRGYTPEGFRLFAERIGVAKSDSWIDYATLEECMREDLNERALRRIAVLDPLKLVIDNYPEALEEECQAPNHPQKPDWGRRSVPFSKELWIEREDFMEAPVKGYFRLFPPGVNAAGEATPGSRVRLRYGFVIECTGFDKDPAGRIVAVHCNYFPDSKSGTPGSDSYKVKGNIHWVSARHACTAEVRLYDRLFKMPHPGAGDRDLMLDLNPDSVKTVIGQLEPALRTAKPGEHYQFERHGYFVADRIDPVTGEPDFNRAVTLKDTWQK